MPTAKMKAKARIEKEPAAKKVVHRGSPPKAALRSEAFARALADARTHANDPERLRRIFEEVFERARNVYLLTTLVLLATMAFFTVTASAASHRGGANQSASAADTTTTTTTRTTTAGTTTATVTTTVGATTTEADDDEDNEAEETETDTTTATSTTTSGTTAGTTTTGTTTGVTTTSATASRGHTPVTLCHREGNANRARVKSKTEWQLQDGVVSGGAVRRASPLNREPQRHHGLAQPLI